LKNLGFEYEFNRKDIYLANADCMDFLKRLPKESVDLCLLDPPYQISRDTNFKMRHGEHRNNGLKKYQVLDFNFGEWDKKISFPFDEMIKQCYRVLKKSGTIICFYDIFKLQELSDMMKSAKFSKIRFGEWIKDNPTPINQHAGYLSNCREVFLTGVKGSAATFHSKYDKGIYEYPLCQDFGKFHPTQKPLELIKDLIRKHSNAGDVVLDCFSGSGSTAVSAYLTDRKFVGCEIDEVYYTRAMLRIKNIIKEDYAVGV